MTADERKDRERNYYAALGAEGLAATTKKPFIADEAGRLLFEIGAVLSVMPNPPARVIDYGCGTGWTTHFLAQRGYEALGVDLSPEAVAGASRAFGLPNLRYLTHDFDGPPPEPSTFDVALFFDALHHADDERVPLQNAFESLRPGGMLVTCEPGTGHAVAETSREAVRMFGVNERDMTPRQVVAAATAVGFVEARVFPHPHVIHGVYKNPQRDRHARLRRYPEMLARSVYAVVNQRNWGIVTMLRPA